MWSLHFIESDKVISEALSFEYDYKLLLISILVAIAAAYTSFLASERIQSRKNVRDLIYWLIAGSFALGYGVWSMHFIGMLSLKFILPVAYDIKLTLISVVPVIIASGIAIYPTQSKTVLNSLLIRSSVLGAGIGLMHYIGMMAMQMQNIQMRYDPAIFSFSLVVAISLSYVALWFRQEAQNYSLKNIGTNSVTAIASVVMGLAISGMHYTGMASVYYFKTTEQNVITEIWEPQQLTLIIMLMMCAVFVILMTAVFFSRNADLFAKLKSSQLYLQNIFDTVPNGLLTVDSKNNVHSFNPEAGNIFGLTQNNSTGLRFDNLIMLTEEQTKSFKNNILSYYSHSNEPFYCSGIHNNGQIFPVSILVSSIERDGKILYVVVVNDITVQKEYESSLKTAKEEAEAANHAKSAFLAAMSHEIRTPMNGVIGMIDVIRQSDLDEGQKDMLKTIQESSFSLLRILDDILDFSKIEAGKMELECIPVNVEKIAESVRVTLRPLAEEKNIELLLLLTPDIPSSIVSDPVRIRQALFNVISNAIKFSSGKDDKKGKVCIAIDYLADNKSLRFRIIDNGIGIEAESQKKLFQSFSQAESSTTRRFGGTGLGLVITQKLVKMMGGNIEVESEINKGSTFTFYINANEADSSDIAFDTDLNEINVLIVSSRQILTEILEKQLADKNANVYNCDPDEIDNYCEQHNFSSENLVVVFDGDNNSDKNKIIRNKIRTNENISVARFVYLENDRKTSPRIEEGDSIFIDTNLLTRKLFLRSVAAVMGRTSIENLVNDETEIPALELARTDNKRAAHKILVAEDNSTNREVITHQMELLGYNIELANDGLQALSMWRNNDYELILTDCHMPEMDGYQLTKTIRDEEKDLNQRIPIIAITADALKGTEQKCISCGMDDYLSKPIQLIKLAPMLDKWLGNSTVHDNTHITENNEHNNQKIVDARFLSEIIGINDEVMLSEIYNNFLSSSSETIIELLVHVKNKNATKINKISHKLKSSARTIGANVLADCCGRLEQAGKTADWDTINNDGEDIATHFRDVTMWIKSNHSKTKDTI